MSGPSSRRLREMLAEAVRDPVGADAPAIAEAASVAFRTLRRTDMRSGVANMIRRAVHLAIADGRGLSTADWSELRDAAALLGRADLTPADVVALDERLRSVGLDVDPVAAGPVTGATTDPHLRIGGRPC